MTITMKAVSRRRPRRIKGGGEPGRTQMKPSIGAHAYWMPRMSMMRRLCARRRVSESEETGRRAGDAPLVRGELEPVADALLRGEPAELDMRVRLPLDHADAAALVVLHDRARGRALLGHDAVRRALPGPEHGAVQHGGLEARQLVRHAVRLQRRRAARRGRGGERAEDRGRVAALLPLALTVRVHRVGWN